MRYFIEISYNGKAYHGWQIQPNAITVQQVIEEALARLTRREIKLYGAGRTDTGVHATQMMAHFDTDGDLSPQLVYQLNSLLPHDIAIQNLFEVNNDAHARFDALSRTYKYRIGTAKNVFNYDYVYTFSKNLNLENMKVASSLLLNYNDFQCFSKSNTDVKTYHCNIMYVDWTEAKDELIFTIKADRFLRNMVRAIVGTMMEIGEGKIEVSQLNDIIKSKNRSNAGYSVPAHGLYLHEIEYPKHITENY